MLLNFNTVSRIIHICVRQRDIQAPCRRDSSRSRGPAGSAAPRSPGVECTKSSRPSHPQLPLLVEIGIKTRLGIFLGDTRSCSHPGLPPSQTLPGPAQATNSVALLHPAGRGLSRGPCSKAALSHRGRGQPTPSSCRHPAWSPWPGALPPRQGFVYTPAAARPRLTSPVLLAGTGDLSKGLSSTALIKAVCIVLRCHLTMTPNLL